MPIQQFSSKFVLSLGILVGAAAGQVALAATEEPSGTRAVPGSTVAAAP